MKKKTFEKNTFHQNNNISCITLQSSHKQKLSDQNKCVKKVPNAKLGKFVKKHRQTLKCLIQENQLKYLSPRIGTIKHLKNIEKSIFDDNVQIKYIKESIKKYSTEEKSILRFQIISLIDFFEGQKDLYEIERNLENIQNKYIKNFSKNITQLLYYELYSQILIILEMYPKALKYLKNCEYFSRTLLYHKFTLQICFKISDTYKKIKHYDECNQYLQNALQLAIKLHDKYSQMKAIDKLGICYYYRGNTGIANFYHNKTEGIEKKVRQLVKQKFDNQQKINSLFSERISDFKLLSLKKQKEKTKILYFNIKKSMHKNFDKENLNNTYLNIRQLTKYRRYDKTVQYLKKSIDQISKIGLVHRSAQLSENKRHIFERQDEDLQNRNQVLISHESINRAYCKKSKKTIDKATKNLFQKLDYISQLLQ